MIVIPIIPLSVIGVKNDFKMEYHIYAFISAIRAFIYCVMEEYGLRGYLQEKLKILKPCKKYLSIGFIWYLWHLIFLKDVSIGNNLFFLGVLILGNWGIGQVAEFTKSIITSACFHMIIQIMMFNSIIKNGIGSTEKIIILIVSVAIWFVIKQSEKKKTLPQKDIRQTQLAICK